MNKQILVIDDDLLLTTTLLQYLTAEGYGVECAHQGEQGLKMALNQPFDAIISEIVLPKCSGFEILQSIREHKNTPMIFLTAREDDVDRLLSLDLGADDYLLKPCDPYELIARLRAILRRTQQTTSHHRPLITHPGITVDCRNRQVNLYGKPLELTNTEFNILEILIKSPEQAFSKEELTRYAMGREFTAYDRSIDVHISNLRNKLGDNQNDEPWIKTVRAFGYQFNKMMETT